MNAQLTEIVDNTLAEIDSFSKLIVVFEIFEQVKKGLQNVIFEFFSVRKYGRY